MTDVTIVLDTNALMMPVECDLRLFDELDRLVGSGEHVVPAAVEAELEKLAAGGGEEAKAASVGVDLLERCTVRDTSAAYADDAVLELATAVDASYVLTNDRTLKERTLAAGVSVIGLRGKNKLAITQP